MVNRGDLAAFLRTRRARLRPGDVGLPDLGRRRTPGLRLRLDKDVLTVEPGDLRVVVFTTPPDELALS